MQKEGRLQLQEFVNEDQKMLQLLLEQPQQFEQKEKILLPLRRHISNRAYRALLIGRIAGIGDMLQAILKRLMRK